MKFRYALAAVALAGAPLAAQPAQAMTCAPGFEVACLVVGTACAAVDTPKFSCQLG